MKRKLSLLVTVIMMVSSLMMSACGKDTAQTPDSQGTPTPTAAAPTQAEAYVPEQPVTITYAGWENKLQNAIIIDEFMKKHKNITVEAYEGGFINEAELTKLAAANSMPDIVAINDLGLAVKNGWLIDLKPYFDADPEAADKSYKNIVDIATINNKLYVLSTGIFLQGLNVNKDLIEANNLTVPGYDWTYEDALKIIRGTVKKGQSLGCLNIDWWIHLMPGAIGRDEIGYSSVNEKTRKFEMGPEWVKTAEIFKQLFDEKVSLWEQADEIAKPWEFAADSPEAKAGEKARADYMMLTMGTTEDGWAAGKTSMQDFPTHLMGWTQTNPRGAEHGYAGFDYDFYPFPKEKKEGNPRVQIITDFAGITPSSADPKAAYEFLKYITYGDSYFDKYAVMKDYDKEAFMAKYPNVPEDQFAQDKEHMYSQQGAGLKAIPAQNTDAARDAYRDFHPVGTPDGSPGISYQLDFIEDGYIDLHRALPGFNEAWGYVRNNIFQQIVHGSKTPSDIAKELETGANQILDNWNQAIKEATAE